MRDGAGGGFGVFAADVEQVFLEICSA